MDSNGRERIDCATAGVVRILDTEERALNAVRILGADRGLNLLSRHESTGAIHPMQLHSGQRPRRALFITDDVRGTLHDHLAPRFRLRTQAELIAERP